MSESVLIIGGGPAGCASAMNLINIGLKPVIVEVQTFPRFHIGESLTTECTDALNRLGLKTKLESLSAPQKYGVRIFSSHPQNSFYVGAGDAWQVERARFDQMMLETAQERGAKVIHGKATRLVRDGEKWKLQIKLGNGDQIDEWARFVIDASGQKRFSHRQGLFSPLTEGNYARQIAFFSHFHNVVKKEYDNDDTLIFHRDTHEWCWIIPLSDEITSVGLVTPVETYKAEKIDAEQFIEKKLNNFSQPLSSRMSTAKRATAVRTIANYSYQIDQYTQQGLYCVGDSHRFIDPIFSFGVEFAVVEAEYMAKSIQKCLTTERSQWEKQEQEYMDITRSAQNTISDMLTYFWAHPWGFANMAHSRYKEEFLELFAGRIYEVEAGIGLTKMRTAIA